jgi:hypothetical protein
MYKVETVMTGSKLVIIHACPLGMISPVTVYHSRMVCQKVYKNQSHSADLISSSIPFWPVPSCSFTLKKQFHSCLLYRPRPKISDLVTNVFLVPKSHTEIFEIHC